MTSYSDDEGGGAGRRSAPERKMRGKRTLASTKAGDAERALTSVLFGAPLEENGAEMHNEDDAVRWGIVCFFSIDLLYSCIYVYG